MLECTLRLFGYGHDLQLFVPDNTYPGHLIMNSHLSERYFSDPVNATIGNAEPFQRHKQPGTIRIFVLGESTTIGFPYMHNGSFHRQLQYRLLQLYPATNFEIINLSLTAVNSFTVRDLASEVVRYEPDAVLIYCGHNEYYGALGVGSTSRMTGRTWMIRTLIRLKQWRTVQLLFNLIHGTATGKKVDTSQNLMERMAREQKIPLGSDLYKRGISQFYDNMYAACKTLSEHHIPVFLSTVVSNEKDLAPFVSSHDRAADDADSLYQKAINAYCTGDFTRAKQYFVDAKEHDLLRFRSPKAIDDQIVTITQQIPGVHMVDSKAYFEANSPHGIIDSSLLLEHVHPNLQGYRLLADAFFTALQQQHILPAAGQTDTMRTSQPDGTPAPLTPVDSFFGAYTISLLKTRWPFHQKHASSASSITLPTPTAAEQALAYDMAVNHLPWKTAMEKLMNRYTLLKDTTGMLNVAEAVMLEYPLEPTFYTIAGHLSAACKQYTKANNYLARAARTMH